MTSGWNPEEHARRDGPASSEHAAQDAQARAALQVDHCFERFLDWMAADLSRVDVGLTDWEWVDLLDIDSDDGPRQRCGDVRNKRGWVEWRATGEHSASGKPIYESRCYRGNPRRRGNISYLSDTGKAEAFRRRPSVFPQWRQSADPNAALLRMLERRKQTGDGRLP